jgi:hypothetical protein
VKSMQCLDCGDECHPKFRHPSSLRTEATVWLVAILIGLTAGAWHAVTSPGRSSLPAISQLSMVAAPVEQPAVPAPDGGGPRNVAVQVGGWLFDRLVQFLRVAWWALPIPILFSTWRQGKKYPVCVRCGSRRLEPAVEVWP